MPNQTSFENSRSDQILPELPFDFTFDSVDSWLSRVPIRNREESSGLIFGALRRLNCCRMYPLQRIEILERFSPYAFDLSDAFESLFIDATFPLDSRVRRISRLSSQIHAQLATGYLLVIDRRDSDDIKISEQEKALTLVRALQSMNWHLIRIIQIYEAPPPSFWKRLYSVLRYAERNNLLILEVPDRNRQTACSIENLFKRITLLWLASPYRHPQHQIGQIVSLLDEHAELAELRNERPDSVTESTFFTDLSVNAPPRHISHLTDRETNACRYIHVRPLVKEIIQFVEDPFSAHRHIERGPDQDLVVRLAETLAGPQDRKHQRKSENVTVRFIMGLTSIIEVVSQSEEQQNGPSPGNPRPLSDLPSFDLLPLDHEKTTPFPRLRGRQQNPGDRVTAEQIWRNEAETEENLLHELLYSAGRLMNSSMQGYQFMTSDDSSSNVKIGEMIAIQQKNQPLQLGVVRWLKSPEDRGIQFGIQLLSRTIHVALATFGVNALRKERILFLGKTAGVDAACSIVLSHAKYRSGTLVEMVITGRPCYFRLHKLIELSPGFVHYSLSTPRFR